MKDKLLKLLDSNKIVSIVETKEGHFFEGITIENSFNEEIINAITMAICTSVMKKETITAVYFMSEEKNYKLPISVKEVLLELVPRSALFNRIDKDGDMKIYRFEEILKEK